MVLKSVHAYESAHHTEKQGQRLTELSTGVSSKTMVPWAREVALSLTELLPRLWCRCASSPKMPRIDDWA